jgi:hypothetical protein
MACGGGVRDMAIFRSRPSRVSAIESGDLGINAVILKSTNIETSHQRQNIDTYKSFSYYKLCKVAYFCVTDDGNKTLLSYSC